MINICVYSYRYNPHNMKLARPTRNAGLKGALSDYQTKGSSYELSLSLMTNSLSCLETVAYRQRKLIEIINEISIQQMAVRCDRCSFVRRQSSYREARKTRVMWNFAGRSMNWQVHCLCSMEPWSHLYTEESECRLPILDKIPWNHSKNSLG